jgi:hypothetical protein
MLFPSICDCMKIYVNEAPEREREKEKFVKYPGRNVAEGKAKLTVRRQHNLHKCLISNLGWRINHLENVVGIIIVAEEQQSIREMIYAVIRDLLNGRERAENESDLFVGKEITV